MCLKNRKKRPTVQKTNPRSRAASMVGVSDVTASTPRSESHEIRIETIPTMRRPPPMTIEYEVAIFSNITQSFGFSLVSSAAPTALSKAAISLNVPFSL